MKKTYEKPEIVFESFALSKSIAADCVYVMNFDADNCVLEMTDTSSFRPIPVFLFGNGNAHCLQGPGVNDDVCYHNPADGGNVFSS